MAHAYSLGSDQRSRRLTHPVHYIAALLLAALVLIVSLTVRDHRPPPQPEYDRTPMTTPPPR
ncbi:MAG: hypothetical protein JWP87_3410 [Labilithrix sp.]|nr:hypothetical protein [Labilithrix sp.]